MLIEDRLCNYAWYVLMQSETVGFPITFLLSPPESAAYNCLQLKLMKRLMTTVKENEILIS